MVFHLLILFVMILIPVIFKNFYITTLGNKQESVDIRKIQLEQSIYKISNNEFNYFIGYGFGKGVPIRPVHMELTYLEIFFKQGILGLSFWFFIFFYCVFHFWKAWKNHVDLNIILPWITGVLVIYLQSITNPLLVNSIGMSFVILAMLFLRDQTKITQEN